MIDTDHNVEMNAAGDRGRIARLIPVGAALVCLAPFVPLVTRSDAIVSDVDRDYAVMHLPLAEFEREELLCGEWPLWNPYVACGQPLQAAQQGLPFYPVSSTLCLALGANRGLKACIFLHLGVCYAGAYCLARWLSLSRFAAAYAALTTTWGGVLLGHLAEGHAGAVFSAALVPWLFLALANLLARPSAGSSVLLGLSGAMCALAAQPQILYYEVVAAVFCSLAALSCGSAAGHRKRATAWGVVAVALALLMASVQLVPVLELMQDGLGSSSRGTAQFGALFALEPADSARLLMPYLNGTPYAGIPQFDSTDHYGERVVYLGIATPALAAYALSRRGARGWQWLAACGVGVALAVAFGDSTPAFSLLGRAVPGLCLFRCPGRVFFVATLPAALLAARGMDALAVGERPVPLCCSARFLAVGAAVCIIPMYALIAAPESLDWPAYKAYASRHLTDELALWAVVAFNTAMVILLGATRRLPRPAVLLALMAAACLDLGFFNVGNFRMRNAGLARAQRSRPADAMARSVEAADISKIEPGGLRYSHWTAAAIREHRLAVGTYDGGVLPAATARLYNVLAKNPRPALALAACGFACSSTGRATSLPDAPLPRARFVPEGLACENRPIEEFTWTDIEEIRRRLVSVRLISSRARHLDLEVNAPVDGSLVIADTYYPGWVCTVDGQARAIESAHGVFRRVRLPAGQHRVSLVYQPRSFLVGSRLTFLGVVLAISLSILDVTRNRSWRRAGMPVSSEGQ